MIVLLTGPPSTGKTTILCRCLDSAKRSLKNAIDARGAQDHPIGSRDFGDNSITTSVTNKATATAANTASSAIGVHFPVEISWLLSREIRSFKKGGERVGFSVESSFFRIHDYQHETVLAATAAAVVEEEEKSDKGNHGFIFAHKFDIDVNVSGNKMMGSYVVDMKVIKEVFCQHILDVVSKSQSRNQLFILDEIGRMQMLCTTFEEALDCLFANISSSSSTTTTSSSSSSEAIQRDNRSKVEASVIASIRSGDEWTSKYTSHPRTVLIELTEENRNDSDLLELFDCLAINLHKIHALKGGKRLSVFTKMFADYVSRQQWVQALKLFKNALKYFIEHRISIGTLSSKTKSDSFSCMSNDADEVVTSWNVLGDHGMHKVTFLIQDTLLDSSAPSIDSYSCDCDLFLSKGKYASLACRECSHIQVVRIFRVPAE